MEKLALMYRLALPEIETIQILIGGIPSRSLRATATALRTDTVGEFLDEMHRITAASEPERKDMSSPKGDKTKELTCKSCGKKGHTARMCGSSVPVSSAKWRSEVGMP